MWMTTETVASRTQAHLLSSELHVGCFQIAILTSNARVCTVYAVRIHKQSYYVCLCPRCGGSRGSRAIVFIGCRIYRNWIFGICASLSPPLHHTFQVIECAIAMCSTPFDTNSTTDGRWANRTVCRASKFKLNFSGVSVFIESICIHWDTRLQDVRSTDAMRIIKIHINWLMFCSPFVVDVAQLAAKSLNRWRRLASTFND